MERRKYCDTASSAETASGEDTEIDVRRVVWDVEYREQVMAALRRREGTREAADRKRSDHRPHNEGKPRSGR